MHYRSIWMRRWILKSSTQAKRISLQGAKAPMAKRSQRRKRSAPSPPRRKRSAPSPPRRSTEALIVFILCGLCGFARDILLTHTGIGHTLRARFRGTLPGWKCDTRGARDRAIGPGAALVPSSTQRANAPCDSAKNSGQLDHASSSMRGPSDFGFPHLAANRLAFSSSSLPASMPRLTNVRPAELVDEQVTSDRQLKPGPTVRKVASSRKEM
jgi:hypothetical protein